MTCIAKKGVPVGNLPTKRSDDRPGGGVKGTRWLGYERELRQITAAQNERIGVQTNFPAIVGT